jgi:uncharacterized membrane protein YbhN (UPF0104 family)
VNPNRLVTVCVAVRRTVWAWVRLVGGAAILVLLLWRLGTGAFRDGLRVIDGGTLVAACSIGLATTVLSAWRWCLVARGLGIRLPLGTAVADSYRAMFLNSALPGGIAGDVHRAVRHGKDTGDVGRGVRAVVLERSAGQAVVVALGVGVLLVSGSRLVDVPGTALAVAAGAVVAVGFGAWAFLRRGGASRWNRALRTAGSDVRRGLLARGKWPGIVVSSALVLVGHIATFVVAARAAGASVPLPQLVPLLVLALLSMMLPVNVGGWGPREGVTAWAFGAAGLSASLGLTVAVVYGVLSFAAALPGAGVLVVRWLAQFWKRSESAYRSSATSPIWRTSTRIARRSGPHGNVPSPTKRGASESPTKNGAMTRCSSSARPAVKNWVCIVPPPSTISRPTPRA